MSRELADLVTQPTGSGTGVQLDLHHNPPTLDAHTVAEAQQRHTSARRQQALATENRVT
ncbi:MAG: hypothetical protein M3Y73_07755 [Actinomycetota bacterium]|nr:hypothetical protein [Actinomycetota bacterium]